MSLGDFIKGLAKVKFDIHYLFSAKHAKWIIISIITLLSCLILIEFASLFISRTVKELDTSKEFNKEKLSSQDSLSSILNNSLFGIYVPNDLNDGTVKKSMLDVTLVGILLADNEEDSQVIIRSASGDERTYKIGDKIPGDALIKRIRASGVLVQRNGVLESLSLPKNELTFEPVPKPLKEE